MLVVDVVKKMAIDALVMTVHQVDVREAAVVVVVALPYRFALVHFRLHLHPRSNPLYKSMESHTALVQYDHYYPCHQKS